MKTARLVMWFGVLCLTLETAAVQACARGGSAAATPSIGKTTTTDAPASPSPAPSSPTPTPRSKKPAPQTPPQPGMVWVNTDTGVFHKGGKFYGNTKRGKWMTEADAEKAGYHEARNERKKRK